ncbi:MAG: ATP-binding cassette domain-containing protein [Caldilineaceae bacterium]|nr:ATP-binding cassette domain-containing protein [Caldilineaceae bacterium]
MANSNQRVIIQLQNVVKTYFTGELPFTALDHVNLDIRQGEFLGITGRSGAGKTTLLNMISGVSKATAGEIFFHGAVNPNRNKPAVLPKAGTSLFPPWPFRHDRLDNQSPNAPIPIHNMKEDKLALWRGENLGIVYQSFELMPTLSLVENVMLPPDFSGGYHPIISKQRALELLELVEIAEHAYKIPAHISGGQKQRVAIARALVNDPQLIIADEPTGNLDSATADIILGIFEKLVDQGKTIIMVTHDQGFVPRFSRHLQIVDGTLSNPAAEDSALAKRPVTPLAPVSEHKRIPLGPVPGPLKIQAASIIHPQETPAIVLRNVEKVYENAAEKFVALRSINLQLNYGQFISIVGKSGCGKSTLLNMITGIDHPTAGEVLIGNKPIYQMSESQRALWRGQNIGVVFQFFQLLPTLTLLENAMLPMDYCDIYPFSERPERAMALLEMVGLADQARKRPAAVSSGQQQSAAIARALATDPPLILADEPTGNLDSRAADKILTLFENLASRGKTVLIVTHDPSITQRTDQTIILSDGKIVDTITPRALQKATTIRPA